MSKTVPGDGAPLVVREDRDHVCRLTLNRPEKRNAINRAMFNEFRRHVRDIETDGKDIGIIVLKGAGASFCAGHDLSGEGAGGGDAFAWLRVEALTLEKLSRLRQPVLAQVHGPCFTGGLELALSADFILCSDSAVFADTHGKFGLVPGGWGMSQRLPRRVGASKAMEMSLMCRTYSGAEAAAMGLANECTPDGELDARVAHWCATILANSWHSNAANKRVIYDTDGLSLSQGIEHEMMRNEGFDMERRRATSNRFAKDSA
jgi:enoyl-CoA hydratase/carnithine racemase